jgi:hypothetical protein
MLDKFILRKSPVEIEVDLLALIFALVKSVGLERFHDQLGPDLFSQRVGYTISDVVNENTLIGLFEIFEIGDDVFCPSLDLATDFLVIVEFEEDLFGEVISPEAILVINGL